MPSSSLQRQVKVSSCVGSEVFLDESWTDVHVELHQRRVADVLEAMDLAGLDHEDVAGARLELLAIDDPQSATFLDELDLVVGMSMRSGAGAGLAAKQKNRHADVSVIDADEVERAPAKRQILLPDAIHALSPVAARCLDRKRQLANGFRYPGLTNAAIANDQRGWSDAGVCAIFTR